MIRQPEKPRASQVLQEPPVPPADVSSQEALAFVQDMQRECVGFLKREDGKELVRAYLARWDPEQRRRIALRIMTDLLQGKAKAGECSGSSDAC